MLSIEGVKPNFIQSNAVTVTIVSFCSAVMTSRPRSKLPTYSMAIPTAFAFGPMVPSGAISNGLETAIVPSGKVVRFWAIVFHLEGGYRMKRNSKKLLLDILKLRVCYEDKEFEEVFEVLQDNKDEYLLRVLNLLNQFIGQNVVKNNLYMFLVIKPLGAVILPIQHKCQSHRIDEEN